MSFNDDLAIWQQILLANAPQLTVSQSSVIYNVASSLISKMGDLQDYMASQAPGMTLAGSNPTQLPLKAQDYGQSQNQGQAATATLTFTIPVNPNADTIFRATSVFTTAGDNVSTPAIPFSLLSDVTVPKNSTSATGTIQCQLLGTIGNVAAHTITIPVNQYSGLTVDNASPASGGIDPTDPTVLKNQCYTFMVPKYSAADIAAAGLAIPGVFDIYVSDPQNGHAVTVYWYDVADASNPSYISGGTLAAAINNALPPAVTNPATLTEMTGVAMDITASWTRASGITQSFTTTVTNTIIAYMNGIKHGSGPNVWGLTNAIYQAVGTSFSAFTCSFVQHAGGSFTPSNTSLPRYISGTSVLSLTEV